MSGKAYLLIIALAGAVSAIAGMYKWTDSAGTVHYGEHPPPGSDALEMQGAMPPEPADGESERERWQGIRERLDRSRALRQEDEARKQQERAERQQREVERKRLCARARSNLHVLEQQRPVYTIDDRGDRVYLDEDQRAVEILRLREFIDAHCP